MILSAVSDTGTTLLALHPSAPSILTGIWSKVTFHLTNRTMAVASTVNKLLHNVREPAQSANIVTNLANNFLLSTSKFVDAGYTAVYDNKEVNYYEKATIKIIMLEDAVLKGWQCPHDKLWCVPLISDVCNLNTDTILLDHLLGHSSLHAMYEVTNTTLIFSTSMPSLSSHIVGSVSTTSTSYQDLSPPSATCMLLLVFPPKHHGSKPFNEATTALGLSSM
jgi:hypothetical protein